MFNRLWWKHSITVTLLLHRHFATLESPQTTGANTGIEHVTLALSHGDEKFKRFRRFWRQFPNMAGACVAKRDQFACQLTRYGARMVLDSVSPAMRPQDNSSSTDEKTQETARFHFTALTDGDEKRRRDNHGGDATLRISSYRIPDTTTL